MIIGLTGGIGSGKSYCAKIFKEIGIPVYNSDERAKILMSEDTELKREIKNLFGDQSYLSNGVLNRKHLSKLIFTDKELLSKMNKLVHPAVRNDFVIWATEKLKSVPYVIQESALLFETGSYLFFNKIILVDAPLSMRIDRVIARDKSTRSEVLDRVNKQLPASEKRPKAHFIIDNDERESVVRKVIEIHYHIINLIQNAKSNS